MIDPDVLDEAGVAVHPESLAALCIHGHDEDAERRPNPRREVDDAIFEHRPAAHRPERNQPGVAQMPPVCPVLRSAPDAPQDRAGLRVQTVQIPVVGTDVHSVAPRHRREPNRPLRIQPPLLLSALRVEGPHAAIHGRPQEEALPQHHRLVGGIEVQPSFVGPRELIGGQFAHPLQLHLGRELLRGGRSALRVVPPRGPVGSRGASRAETEKQAKCGRPSCNVAHRSRTHRGIV